MEAMSQMRMTLAEERLMMYWSAWLMTRSMMVKRCPTSFPTGAVKMFGCQTRMVLSTPPVAIRFALMQKSNAFTPFGNENPLTCLKNYNKIKTSYTSITTTTRQHIKLQLSRD